MIVWNLKTLIRKPKKRSDSKMVNLNFSLKMNHLQGYYFKVLAGKGKVVNGSKEF